GAKVSTIDANFIQGSLETTDVNTDIAINGKGFFVVEDSVNDEDFYTRAGHFIIDNQGYYVNTQGYRVQGYLYDNQGVSLINTLSDIQINQNSMIPPQVTGNINMALNLDVSETPLVWNINNPSGTSHFSTGLNIFDSLGQSHQIQVYFTKTADQTWQWNAVVDGSDVQGGTPGVVQLYGTGDINFDVDGQLSTAMPVSFYTGAITFANGIAPPATTIDLTDTTQFGAASVIQVLNQDGYAAGTVSGINIDEEGNLVANYTNGTRRRIARLVLADFPNLNGLERKGATLFQATTRSGDPLYNMPGLGGMGNISSSMLEESNVDIAAEFIKMIIIQRGYQANTKVISTTDEMLAQLINIL
ncbi:MAG: flagellar hook protein FlgE, partial [Deltaproteobacteria bacterium]|nr:flagellar hook protein FlgE [Deltaproteobacteria bacterium]